MATDATRAPGVCLLQHPGEVACLVRPAVDLPQRAPLQVLVGVDQRAPAVEGPLPDLLARDRVRGQLLTAGCAAAGRRLPVRFSRAWPGGCLVERDKVRSTAGAATCLDVGRGHDCQVELGPVGELGEDPPDVLTVGSG